MSKETKRPITRAGYRQLAAEHEQLSKKDRPKVVEGIQTAAAEGDRSENAEYIYGRKRLRELDKRINYLNKLLTDIDLIDPDELLGDRVCFGSTVVVNGLDDGQAHRWFIVGEGETDRHEYGISWKSPVALALLGKKVGDTVTIRRPAGDIEVEVVDLFFGRRNWKDPF
jgi:transcription elongation factor GreB